ncbi:hypothetical protein LTR10_002254 [Elasticomyces elasticus]|nr:hypothetical protein LTR10_002254 [Elasticomyces elasticus]KAK4973673.1 hypothetical protein LTR42_005662 [Elasticomyces elasticus]
MMQSVAFAALSFGAGVYAQQAGTLTAEVHPKLSVSKCAAGGTCTAEQHTIVLDANWRWLHSTSGATNCYDGNTWNSALCPDPVTCAANCALDGGDYSGTYGIKASGTSLSLQLVTGSNSGSRSYLMDTTDTKYQEFNLLNQEFTFDVDVSKLPCGLNGALYFVQMAADGGVADYPTNKAGAKYGTGYCDAQCPQDIKFIGGKANNGNWTPSSNSANTGAGGLGACCSEMDIWEANSQAAAYTPHPCSPEGYSVCDSAAECGGGICDKAGCDFNSYRQGNTTFYGPGGTVDTNKVMTVVTQFITSDGTSSGDLTEIKRFYVQGGKVYANSASDIAGVSGNSITSAFCKAQKSVFGDSDTFSAKGGLKAMGESFRAGMVLVMSIWDDYAVNMLWLDSDYPTDAPVTNPGVARGPCATTSGNPKDVESKSPGSTVVFSNIRTGPIGSTYSGVLQPGGSGGSPPSSSSSAAPVKSSSSSAAPVKSSSSSAAPVKSSTTSATIKTTSTKASSTSSASAACATKFGQCGGSGWKGPTCCAAGSTCKASGDFYSQCL